MAKPSLSKPASRDSDTLALLGKKQVLKRRFGFWSVLGFAVCELITWETVLAIFTQGFSNGGPAGLIYGFIIAWSSTLSVYTVISELASLAPIAGGQYYWVYMLAPPRWKVFTSYIVGWLTSLAWVATVATETIFAGTILQGLIILNHEDSYVPENWQGTLMAWLVVAVAIFVNAVIPGALPKVEIFIIVFHIAGFIAIVSVLWVFATPKNTAEFVFTTSLNEGGWSTQGLSYCVGFLGNVATFVGADASVHMAEEVENAARNIPRAIVTSMCINGAVGFVMMITALYCLGDVDKVLNTPTGYPFLQIFYGATNSHAGATVMGAVVLSLTWACATGIITTASRMTWSFARDRGTPFSSALGKVSHKKKIPVVALLATTGFACLLTLIYVGSDAAFNDVISLTITGFYSSYFLPAAFLLYNRVKGNIAPHRGAYEDVLEAQAPTADGGSDRQAALGDTSSDKAVVESDLPDLVPQVQPTMDHQPRRKSSIANTQLMWGPFHLPGWIGIVNNAYACVYMVFVIFWSVWPAQADTNYQNMNYSIVVTGAVIIFSIVWYFVRGRKEYDGPTIDEEVEAVMRKGSVAER